MDTCEGFEIQMRAKREVFPVPHQWLRLDIKRNENIAKRKQESRQKFLQHATSSFLSLLFWPVIFGGPRWGFYKLERPFPDLQLGIWVRLSGALRYAAALTLSLGECIKHASSYPGVLEGF